MTDLRTLSPLARTVAESPTDVWNDSCAIDELECAIAFGAVGATANPTIVHDVWRKDPAHWRGRARAMADAMPAATEVEIAWDEFDTFGPTVRTLRAFIGSYHDLLHAVTDAVLPNPDVRAS